MYIEGIKACICEGAAAGAIIDILVDNGLLIFSREEMLDEKVIRSRTILAERIRNKSHGPAYSGFTSRKVSVKQSVRSSG